LPMVLVFASLLWSALRADEFQQGDQYSLRWNPLYWIFTVVFSIGVGLGPIPTSLLLTGSASASVELLVLVIAGAILSLIGIAMYFPRRVCFGSAGAWLRRLGSGNYRPDELLIYFLLLSLVPSMFLKAAELYATQALPYAKVLLLRIVPRRTALTDRLFFGSLCVMWLLASAVNLMFYSLVLGSDADANINNPSMERWVYAQVGRAVGHRTRDYSIYDYSSAYIPHQIGGCYVDARDPDICLPKSIANGVPTWRVP